MPKLAGSLAFSFGFDRTIFSCSSFGSSGLNRWPLSLPISFTMKIPGVVCVFLVVVVSFVVIFVVGCVVVSGRWVVDLLYHLFHIAQETIEIDSKKQFLQN